jgi:hypothetical protein
LNDCPADEEVRHVVLGLGDADGVFEVVLHPCGDIFDSSVTTGNLIFRLFLG